MPHARRHRSHAPEDPVLFAPEWIPALRRAVAELSWLLGRGYPEQAARKLVGDRHRLRRRQRLALARCACDPRRARARRRRRLATGDLRSRGLVVDGFNLLTTVETALGGGLLLVARDGCLRDLAGLGGTWRRVAETRPALEAVGAFLTAAGAAPVRWLLDRPVSNSGRLAALIRRLAQERDWPWRVETVDRVDERLREELIQTYRVAPADKIVSVPLGIDLSAFA
ncbi:MAG: DUF434 domain-containing protein, partial [Planctomycetota bacterium]